jgi:outer membrane immunogenic protein
MKRIWLTTAFALLGTVSAVAADLSARTYKKAPAMIAPATNWTGFYVGGGFGYGSYQGEQSSLGLNGLPGANSPSTGGGKGWLATVTTGFDLQFADRFVAGVFADYDFNEIKGRVLDFANAGVIARGPRDGWSVGGRLGVLATPSTLVYATGGYTQADFRADNANFFIGTTPADREAGSTHHGWFGGVGVETMLGQNWSGRLEYRYADYDSERGARFNFAGTTALGLTETDPVVQTMRASLAYKFGVPSIATAPAYAPPVVASSGWTGLFVGGGLGYGGYQTESRFLQTVFPAGIPDSNSIASGGKGVLGTVTIGYDQQFADRFVAGVFADYDFTSAKGTYSEYSNSLDAFAVGTLKQQSAWAVGGRIGYLATAQSLLYATGGYTEARFDAATLTRANIFNLNTTTAMPGRTYTGWFAGAGAETQFAPNWSMRLEYRYAEYDSETLAAPVAPTAFIDRIVLKPTVQTVRAGIVYKFGGPVTAKY